MRLVHGGDITTANADFGPHPDGWLDLSTGINPVPYEIDPSEPLGWEHLPTHDDLELLNKTARNYYGLQPSAGIAASPGTQAIIQWLPRLRPQGTVHIVDPTYGEHAHCWRNGGHQVRESSDIEDADVVVVVNPNNPTGRTFDPAALAELAAKQHARNGWLIVDEAFADVVPEVSSANVGGTPGLLILRSFGKFFGLAGARLGFLISSSEIISNFETALGPWAVSGPAIAVGTRALADQDWHTATVKRLKHDAKRLDDLLAANQMRVLGGTPLFRLVEVPDAMVLRQKLGEAGIMIRVFEDHPTWVRFGLPGPEADWNRLENALAA